MVMVSYKLFLFKQKATDSKQSYVAFLTKHEPIFSSLPTEMRRQYVNMNYPLRFINNAWA